MITLEAVRFCQFSGKVTPVIIQAIVGKFNSGTLKNERWVQISGGVTGYESFCIEGKSTVDFNEMKANGWWACAGTPGRWDALYIHGLQMTKLFKEIDKEKCYETS